MIDLKMRKRILEEGVSFRNV